MPLILTPLFMTMVMKMKMRFRRGKHFLRNTQSLAFYMWSLYLIIVIGKSTIYVMAEPSRMILTEIMLAVAHFLLSLSIDFGRYGYVQHLPKQY